MARIKPTPGRIVWYYPGPYDIQKPPTKPVDDNEVEPLAAIVVGVYTEKFINITVFDFYGHFVNIASVPLVQEDDVYDSNYGRAEWMPYQKGQASKYEALEAKAAPASDEASIEAEIQRKGLNAPRLSPDAIDAQIKSADFYVFPGSQLTVCCLTLQNGFTVTGESACASPENFNAEIGQTIAKRNAREKIWALEGYLLKERLNPRK